MKFLTASFLFTSIILNVFYTRQFDLKINNKNQQKNTVHKSVWIFVYGSLINKFSRDKTVITNQFYPVYLHGFKRVWNLHTDKYTAVNLVEEKDKTTNGLLINIPISSLENLSKREELYELIKLDPNSLKFFNESDEAEMNSFPPSIVYTYISNPNYDYFNEVPISLMYVYTILLGCYDVSTEFAERFMQSTYEWIDIENDISNPKGVTYMKNVIKKEDMYKVDKLLDKYGIDK